MKKLITLFLLLVLTVGCKTEKVEEAAPAVEEVPVEVTE